MGLTKPARGWRVTDAPWDDIYRGIEGLWLFNEGTGDIVADCSGHGRHGTVEGATWVAGPSGWCGSFDGINDRVVLSGVPNLFMSHSIVGCVRVRNNTTFRPIFAQGITPTGHTVRFYARKQNETYSEYYAYNAITLVSVATGPAGQVEWTTETHAAVYGRPTVTVYTNGIAGTTGTMTIPDPGVTLPTHIGNAPSPTAALWYAGEIEWVGIWSRALSAQEVRRLHEQPPWMVG